MNRVTVLALACVTMITVMPSMVFGDMSQFVDWKVIRAEIKHCYTVRDKYEEKCRKIVDPGDEIKCSRAALTKLMGCQKSAENKGIVKFDKWPPKARKEAKKIIKKQQKAYSKCMKKNYKCMAKCSKKARGDGKKFDKCKIKSECDESFGQCMWDAGEKYSIVRSKKLQKILKGKKPE